MSGLADTITGDFLVRLLTGMLVNLEIAGISLAAGLVLGLPLALARLGGGVAGAGAASLIALLRAAPTFVVMFFLLNAVPRDAAILGLDLSLSGIMVAALSLVPYSAAFVADSGLEAMRQLRRRSPLGALLFLPNVSRAFFVLVMSSSAAAAVGVSEAISVILRETERLPRFADRLVLFATGIVCFGLVLQTGFAAMRLLHRRLARSAASGRHRR